MNKLTLHETWGITIQGLGFQNYSNHKNRKKKKNYAEEQKNWHMNQIQTTLWEK